VSRRSAQNVLNRSSRSYRSRYGICLGRRRIRFSKKSRGDFRLSAESTRLSFAMTRGSDDELKKGPGRRRRRSQRRKTRSSQSQLRLASGLAWRLYLALSGWLESTPRRSTRR
jgi:hypothetical protein